MSPQEAAGRIQRAYPRIYLACHVTHKAPGEVSRRNGTILAHRSPDHPTAQQDLQRHLGIAKSTMSEALSKLGEEGLIERNEGGWVLTAKGTAARRGGSVLDWDRLVAMAESLAEPARTRAVEGLELLAEAASRN